LALRSGLDIYTFNDTEAFNLARSVNNGHVPRHHLPHGANGGFGIFFQHWHPYQITPRVNVHVWFGMPTIRGGFVWR